MSCELSYENVNGIMLLLCIKCRESSPNSKQFTIYFKGGEERGTLTSIASLGLAILFNIVALSYVQISLTMMMLIFSVLGFLLLFWVTHSVQSETLLVIPTIGIQTSIKYICGKEDCFVPWSSIDDVIINEVIQMNRVLYYLTILVKESDNVKLVPVFKCTRPRLLMLEAIYKQIQILLTEYQDVPDMKASGDIG